MRRPIPAALAAVLLGAATAWPRAQAPLGPPVGIRVEVATADPADGTPGRTRLDLGREALTAGRTAEAVTHLLAALELHPASPAILRALLAASAGDPDARAAFGLALALASCDARGRPQLERGDRDLLLPKDAAKDLASAQAAAVAELARHAGKLRPAEVGSGLVARWAADLAIDLGRDAPEVLAAAAEDLNSALAAARPDSGRIFAALRRLLDGRPAGTAAGTEPDAAARDLAVDRAIRAARILSGLAAQVAFGEDLQGPPPPELGALAGEARQALADLRARVAAGVGEPWTLERLRALSPEQQLEFTAAHASWANPGVARSPSGLYTVWTTCGYETLVGAVATIEDHHRRLAGWFGADPFANRPGTVRIEPEHDGLETNGAPFWWAGGFQSGDLTVLRFAWGSIEALGRGLTHELTHRFDGVLHPFLPAWLTEGRAVWTGRSYGRIEDGSFVPNHLAPHAIQGPFVDGYGDVRNLTRLLDGTIDDYRDNYSAGYALYTYLATWVGADGAPLFAERLERFMKNARGGRGDPVAYFVDQFADGEAGRPAGLEAFAAGFREFMHQCYRWSWGGDDRDAANAFITERYRTGGLGTSKAWQARVMDDPTFSWARSRAEPWFGQIHALAAARLLAECGETDAAAAAACWSLQVDGWREDNARLAAELLGRAGAGDAAWAVQLEAARRIPTLAAPATEAPWLGRLTKVRGLLRDLRATALAHRDAGRPLAAASVGERHDRLARAVGVPLLGLPVPAEHASALPRRENPHALGTLGWVEDGLTGYEERRVPGLWFETGSGDLHVGRREARDATGAVDRAAHQRHAFVRSVEWQAPGRYRIRARIHFTTSFSSGALVFGWTRRDRNLRLGFSAGDRLYAIGRKDEDAKQRSVSLSLGALWERDGPLLGRGLQAKHEFDQPSSFVDIELRVDGATVDCLVMGERKFSYTTPDLSGIEGAVGFATGQGAVRVQTPSVQRLDRGALVADEDPARSLEDLFQRRLGAVPAGPSGGIVVWLPRDEDHTYLVGEARRALIRLAKPLRDRLDFPQPWSVMVPADLPAEVRAALDVEIRALVPDGLPFVDHVRLAAPERSVWVLFVDAQRVVRAAGTAEIAMPDAVRTWARLYRPPVEPGAPARR